MPEDTKRQLRSCVVKSGGASSLGTQSYKRLKGSVTRKMGPCASFVKRLGQDASRVIPSGCLAHQSRCEPCV
jgi:hypothetical protein